jgi:hypothetical protein
MSIDYAEPLKKAFGFCLQPKRWLPFFIVDLAFVSVAITLILANSLFFLYLFAGIEDITLLEGAGVFFAELVTLFIAWVLVSIWISGAVIHQSHKEKEFGKSWTASTRRYLSLLGVTAVTAITAFITGLVPYVGWVLSILVGIIFFFSMQSVIVKNNGFVKALQDSWKLFRKQPFKVFLMWIVIAALALLIVAVFAIPIIALLYNIFIDFTASGSLTAETIMNLVYAIENQLPLLVVSGVIFVLGMAISRAYTIKAQTEYYLQLKKAK